MQATGQGIGRRAQKQTSAGLICCMMVLLLLGAAGCATEEPGFPRIINEPAPVPPLVRARFGVVGILPSAAAASLHFYQPVLPPEAGINLAEKAYREMDRHLDSGNPAGEMSRTTLNTLLSLSPTAVGDVVPGVPVPGFKACQEGLRRAMAEEPLDAGLDRELAKELGPLRGSNVVILPAAAVSKVKALPYAADFSALADDGVDSVLDIRVTDIAFEWRRGANPELSLAPKLAVYVIRVLDGRVLHASFLDYRGLRHRLAEWGANDARAFRIEMALAEKAFADSIIEQYFSAGRPK